jgi:YVTN family beta-propeller protein
VVRHYYKIEEFEKFQTKNREGGKMKTKNLIIGLVCLLILVVVLSMSTKSQKPEEQPKFERIEIATGDAPHWSPDGKKLAFMSGGWLCVRSADGKGEIKKIAQIGINSLDWMSDSEFVFTENRPWTTEGKGRGHKLIIETVDMKGQSEPSLCFAQSDSVIATVGVEDQPLALVYNPINNKIYCANWESDNVTIIDGAGDSVIATVGVGNYPCALAYNTTNNRIYCVDEFSDNVTIIDGAGDSVVATVGVGHLPWSIACFNNKIYCTNYYSANVTIIDGSGDSVMATVKVGSFPFALGYNSTDNKIYCTSSYIDSVTILDSAGDSVIATLGAGDEPYALTYNPITNKIYCANFYSHNVTIIDGAGDSVITTVTVGDYPWALAHNSFNNKIYCANSWTTNVTIIDGGSDSVIAVVGVGNCPSALAYNPADNKIYCANRNSDNVTIIDGAGDSVMATLVVGDSPVALTYNFTNNKIYCANAGASSVSVIACSSPTGVEEDRETQIIQSLSLKHNYPNPFNPATRIQYTGGSRQIPIRTTLKIYNVLGQLVRTLVDEPKGAGSYEVIWDGKDEKGKEAASGIYFYQLKAGDYIETKKMLLLK